MRMQERRARQADTPYYRRAGFIGAAVFVLAVLLAGIVLIITSGSAEDPAAAPTPPPAADPTSTSSAEPTATEPTETTAPPSVAPTSGTEGCPDLGEGSGQAALAIAPEVQWSPLGEIAMAVSEGDGPAVSSVPSACYSRSAAGALLAAHNFFAEVNDPSKDAVAVVTERVAEGEVRDRLLTQVGTGQPTPFAAVGYRFIDATEDASTVRIVYQTPGTTAPLFLSLTISLSWDGDDWKVTDIPDPEQIDGVPAGFVEWGPRVGAEE